MRRSRWGAAPALLMALGLGLAGAQPAAAQGLGDLVKGAKEAPTDTVITVPPAPALLVAGEVALGAGLAALAGYAVGLAAESLCAECDAGEPGGDLPGLLAGVPAGALVGTWFLGRTAPPMGSWEDTALGALAGTAVFAGYAELLKEQGDGLRWAGVLFPAGMAALGWNRSRAEMAPELTLRQSRLPMRTPGPGSVWVAELSVVRVRF